MANNLWKFFLVKPANTKFSKEVYIVNNLCLDSFQIGVVSKCWIPRQPEDVPAGEIGRSMPFKSRIVMEKTFKMIIISRHCKFSIISCPF